MMQIFARESSVKLPSSKAVARHEQFGRSPKGYLVCASCQNIFFKKRWWHPASVSNRSFELFVKGFDVGLCPACKMEAAGLFEGEIIVDKLPIEYEEELVNLIHTYARRTRAKDPQHRLIGLFKEKDRYRITLTENQMAAKLAKKIAHVFGHADLILSHSREPYEVERAYVRFGEQDDKGYR